MNNTNKKGGSGLTDRFGKPLTSGTDAQASSPSSETRAIAEDLKLPEVNFTNHIISLMTTATSYCGIQTHPDQKNVIKHRALAQYQIDTIAMLKDKCKDTLSTDETRFVDEVLYELRRLFVQAFAPSKENKS